MLSEERRRYKYYRRSGATREQMDMMFPNGKPQSSTRKLRSFIKNCLDKGLTTIKKLSEEYLKYDILPLSKVQTEMSRYYSKRNFPHFFHTFSTLSSFSLTAAFSQTDSNEGIYYLPAKETEEFKNQKVGGISLLVTRRSTVKLDSSRFFTRIHGLSDCLPCKKIVGWDANG